MSSNFSEFGHVYKDRKPVQYARPHHMPLRLQLIFVPGKPRKKESFLVVRRGKRWPKYAKPSNRRLINAWPM